MRQTQPRLKTVAIKAGKDPKRSPLFHWLMDNHKRLAPGLSKARVDWGPVIATAISAGVKNDWGGDPIEQNIRRTWRNVCQVLVAEQANRVAKEEEQAARSPRKLQPRDMPKDWRPVPIEPPVTSPQPSLRQLMGPVTSGPDLPQPDYTGMDDVERKIARMEWSIKKRGG